MTRGRDFCSSSPDHHCHHSRDRRNTGTPFEKRDNSICTLDKLSSSSLPQSDDRQSSNTRKSTPVKQLFDTHLPACFASGKNCLYRGKTAHMANSAVREKGSNVAWMAKVTYSTRVRNSLLPVNYEPSPSSCRQSNRLHPRYDSCENIEIGSENVTRLQKQGCAGN